MNSQYIKMIQKRTLIVGLILTLVLGFWRLNFGLGLLLGLVVGQLNFLVHQNYVDNLLFKGEFTLSLFIFNAVVNYGLMILAFILSITLPSYFSIYMVGLGLIMLKLVVYMSEFLFKNKGVKDDRRH